MATIHQSNHPPASIPKRERKPAWELTLYVAGQTPKSIAAFKNLKKICEEYLAGQYCIEVVDLLKEPHLAKTHQILAIPTVIRELPLPIRKVVGDLSNLERALVGLGLPEAV